MPEFEFMDRVVMISGAASGIGRRAAARFAAEGAMVIGGDLRHDPDAAAGVDLRRLDVTQEEDWQRETDRAMALHGRLDVLVNCAGILIRGSVTETRIGDFRKVMAVNVEGTFLGMKHAMRVMRPAGHGAIVNISSIAGLVGAPSACAYSASKGAVRLMTKSAALDALAIGSTIRVNSVHPTVTDTPMLEEMVRQRGGGDQVKAALEAGLPPGGFATPTDIVEAVMFLASDRARFINGSELVVDNGYTAR